MVALLIIGLPCLFMARTAVFRLGRIWAKNSLWLLDNICGTKVEFRGVDQLPHAPFIVAAKHQSMWETFALIMLFDDFCYILKKELTYIPLFGWYIWKADQIAIDRRKGSSALAQAEQEARKIFHEGRSLFIFPEGTRRPAGAMPKYKHGVGHIYSVCDVPCVPVALNSGLFWARRSWLRRPGTIIIDVLDPIAPGMEKQAFLDLLQARLEKACDDLLEEAVSKDATLKPILLANRQIA